MIYGLKSIHSGMMSLTDFKLLIGHESALLFSKWG